MSKILTRSQTIITKNFRTLFAEVFDLEPPCSPNPKINPRNETNLARDTANRHPAVATIIGALREQITISIEVEVVSNVARVHNARPEVASAARPVRDTADEVAAIREITITQSAVA